ncbi:Peptidoglycan/LPS O-acetylase OafA/YrhL, contains acyltransferase and SGNH-hydrolase domains [Micromonospora viridifaciens]|uniref:Peptidoglycan/LPS O-acetylase OafA/YrhL, contains acyltransferase and SGNH-hydrolase domains n=2 Tax=Micromonospora viridifaciens TaxID=1881 RepID=A0A1C4ZKZ6_MICVI|nr:Peptidoglycan/LPS O-acetylase OafA/YrhL, contains acyltransferase and SGNH-hydrolase domains [Micromonospora viridifaciens]
MAAENALDDAPTVVLPRVDLPVQPTVSSRRDTTPVAARPSVNRLYVLDGLRFLAALSVVGFHVIADYGNRNTWGRPAAEVFGPAVLDVFEYGWLGVECFFVISGFVICMSCWGRTVSEFAISRVTRLMPAYVFAVLVTSAALFLFPLPDGRPRVSDVLVNTTMLQQFFGIRGVDFVYWTLFEELKFYLLFAVLAYFGLTYRRVILFCFVWMAAALYGQYTNFAPVAKTVSSEYASYFVAGILLYLIYRFGPNLLLLGGFAVAIVTTVPSLIKRVSFHSNGKHIISFDVAFVIMLCFFLLMLAVALGWLASVRWRALTVVGALTYPLYLLHMQLGRIIVHRIHDVVSPWILVAGLVVGFVAFAYVVQRFVERPVARMLRVRLRESFAQIRVADRNDRQSAPAG